MKLTAKTILSEQHDRWDLQVSKNHNFIAEGVVVHNSNFVVSIEGADIRVGKRSSFLGEDASFFNFQRILPQLKINIANLQKLLPQVQGQITVYGEIFGGRYEHKDVPPVRGVAAIQKGIDYSPDIHFIAFDLFYNGEFANAYERVNLCQKAGFLTMPILFEGTLEECLAYNHEFVSTIPTMLGLPPIEDNICEGVVIKPVDPLYLMDGDRVILKHKSTKFAEHGKTIKVKTHEPLPEDVQAVFDILVQYINENRLNSVISKMGEISIKDFPKVMNNLRFDAMEEFLKDHREKIDALDKEKKHVLNKSIGSFAAQLVKEHLIKL